jgi:hypothetical protein
MASNGRAARGVTLGLLAIFDAVTDQKRLRPQTNFSF